jgi:hypothetical protein
MKRNLWVLLALLPLLTTGTAEAQDAGAIARAAAAAMGTDTLQCLTYSGGGGYVSLVGQGFSPADDWPRVELESFSRVINFEARTMREEQVRRQGNYSPQGGGRMPIVDQRLVWLVSGNRAWDMNGTTVVPQPAAGDARQLEMYLDPHGFLKGALAAADLVSFERNEGGGERRSILSYTVGRFRVQGSVNADNEVVRIQTFVPNPLLGDMVEEKTYGSYQTFGSVKFPTTFHNHTNWDHELRPQGFFGVRDGGHNSFGISINEVQPNACGDAVTVPGEVQNATVPAVNVASTEVADGVFYRRVARTIAWPSSLLTS